MQPKYKCPTCGTTKLRVTCVTTVDFDAQGPVSGTEWVCLSYDALSETACLDCDRSGTLKEFTEK